MSLTLAVIIGWALGSIPVAFLVVRAVTRADLSAAGSSNIGARNAYRVSGSRRLGIIVLLLDALKGVVAVLAGAVLAPALGGGPVAFEFDAGAAAFLASIAGHNYNLFLSLRAGRLVGGKGLATGAGGGLLLVPALVVVWIISWLTVRYVITRRDPDRDDTPANIVATVILPLAGLLMHGLTGLFLMIGFAALVIPRHTGPLAVVNRRTEGEVAPVDR